MKTLLLLISIISLIACGSAPKSVADSTSSGTNFKSSLVGTEWSINGPAFVNKSAESFTLTTPKEEKNFPSFGHVVTFNEDGTFSGRYRAMCGNDCFTDVNGKYSFKDNLIEIFIEKASNHGFCNDSLLILNKKMGAFEIITQKDKSILLKRM